MWKAAGLGKPTPQQSGFWPARGPVWDGAAIVYGKGNRRGILLIEAKSHVAELRSGRSGAGGERLKQIRIALDEVKRGLGVRPDAKWAGRYYQITNRLAYLYYLRQRRQIDAWLASVYFLKDWFNGGSRTFPAAENEWGECIRQAKQELRLPARHALTDYQKDIFVPASPG